MCASIEQHQVHKKTYRRGGRVLNKYIRDSLQMYCTKLEFRMGTTHHSTVGKNIIATINMRNNFCYPLKMAIFPIFYCSPFSYYSPNFAIAKVIALNLFASIFVYWFMASFLYCLPYSYRSFNYC